MHYGEDSSVAHTPIWAQNAGPEDTAAWPKMRPKLWWVLVASCFTLMTTLAIVLTVLWKHDHDRTMDSMQEVYNSSLTQFNTSVNVAAGDIVKRVQGQVVRRAHQKIQDFLRFPETVVAGNVKSVKIGVGIFTPGNISRAFTILWMQIQNHQGVSDNCYTDSTGVFVGYEHIQNGTFLATYRPPDAFATSPIVCPVICPPLSRLAPGQRGFYIADKTGGFGEKVVSLIYNVSTRPWYQLGVEAKGEQGWTRPFPYTNGLDIGLDNVQAIMDGDRPRMVFDASISLRSLSEFLDTVHRDLHPTKYQLENAVSFIVDVEGYMVASSRGLEEVVRDGPHGVKVRRTWREIKGYSVRAALLPLNGTGTALPLPTSRMFPDTASDTDFPSVTLHSQGGPYLCAYGTVKFKKNGLKNAAIDWILVSIVRKRAYMRTIEEALNKVHEEVEQSRAILNKKLEIRTRRTTVFGAVVTLLGGALMACVARTITMPIRRISKEMRSIAELKFMDAESPELRSEAETATTVKRRGGDSFRTITTASAADTADDGDSDESLDGDASSVSSSLDSEAEHSKRRSRRCCCRPLGVPVRELVEMRQAFASMSSGLQSFAKYVDPHVVELLVRGRAQAQLGVEKADVTIFFSDIAGFTTMGETLEPDRFMDLLSEYLEEMSSIITRHKGVVGEYIGDGIMAWWNTPLRIGPTHTVQALSAALDQQRRLAELRHRWHAASLPEVRVRMGLTRGTVLAGNVGSRRRMKFGLVGDSVNLASRLEALCKRYGVSVLVDGSVREAPEVAGAFLFRPLDLVVVKGRSGTTELFELVAAREDPEAQPSAPAHCFAEEFAAVLALYRAGDFRGALGALEPYRRRWPDDVPARMVVERCGALLAQPPGPGWSPVETLTDK